MRILYIILCIWMPLFYISAQVQVNLSDTLLNDELPEVTVSGNHQQKVNQRSALQVEVAGNEYLREHFSGNLIQSLSTLPGVQSMDIGSGFSKPVIRGLGFNRISFVEHGIKQEGQQWGADHGLETDPFNADEVLIRKGPSSLIYGSDAMGGVIEVKQAPLPVENQLFGEAAVLGKSVNSSLGGSLLMGIKKDCWYAKLRYSEQHYRDYRIPTDTIVYLTQKMPIYNRRLKNTAGLERHASLHTRYHYKTYRAILNISNSYQKSGFFPGAHGVPDISRLGDDGDSGNIDLPYNKVNHFKASLGQQYLGISNLVLELDLGYQNNHREEWSLFHTHYKTQPKPEVDPNKELEFDLNTYSSTLRIRSIKTERWEHAATWDVQYQRNRIAGYNFLLPEYDRFTTGFSYVATWYYNDVLSFSGGLRYDYGRLDISSFFDSYLETYLLDMGYDQEQAETNALRSRKVNRDFGDFSGSLGMIWQPNEKHLIKMNIGRSFRLPGANELSSNGVHHGTFRHEQGDSSLKSEQGWQLDATYSYTSGNISINLSPYLSWYNNYIYLRPTGELSILPHAGQIYKFTGTEAFFAGSELSFDWRFTRNMRYHLSGEYVYTYNLDRKVALSFSPPASVRHHLEWQVKNLKLNLEHHIIASQKRVANNEETTSGAQLLNATVMFSLPFIGDKATILFSARNLFNKCYYNHMSFYRQIEIPEPGRSFQITCIIPFKLSIK